MPDPAKHYLDLAARLALRGAGDVEPNPMVGAVIVKHRQIIGMGHHRRFGGRHAEREALDDCIRRGHSPRGADIYITLEPCNHHGKQPPCSQALIEAGITRAICARPDPNPASTGGAAALRAAGIACEFTDASPLAATLSDPFIKGITTGLPWVVGKWAQTIDGRIATRTGESRWISGEVSRRRVHRLRARIDAILTGMGTVLADDPLLSARGVPRIRRLARRIVIDPDLDIPPASKLVQTARAIPLTVICSEHTADAAAVAERRAALDNAGVDVLAAPSQGRGLDLEAALRRLRDRYNTATLMVEAGAGLLGAMFEADLIDECLVYIAPLVMGDEQARPAATGRIAAAIADARRYELRRVRRSGEDVELTYRRRDVGVKALEP